MNMPTKQPKSSELWLRYLFFLFFMFDQIQGAYTVCLQTSLSQPACTIDRLSTSFRNKTKTHDDV